MFYIAYLNWKDSNDYTGVESHVKLALNNKDISWFPLNRARELRNDEEELKREEKEAIHKIR